MRVHLQDLQVKFVYKGCRVKIKVKVKNAFAGGLPSIEMYSIDVFIYYMQLINNI